jgi:hypothetical protein
VKIIKNKHGKMELCKSFELKPDDKRGEFFSDIVDAVFVRLDEERMSDDPIFERYDTPEIIISIICNITMNLFINLSSPTTLGKRAAMMEGLLEIVVENLQTMLEHIPLKDSENTDYKKLN